MIDLSALVLCLFMILDGSQAEQERRAENLDVPPNIELVAREDVRIPWAEKTYDYGSAPVIVEMADILEAEAEKALEPEPIVFRKKNRIPGLLPPELGEIERMRALLLPPSDRVQILRPRPQVKSVTSSVSNSAIDSNSSGLVPPDPEIAASSTHLVAVVNSSYQVFDAATGAALTSAISLSSLMGGRSDCSSLFDPNAIYDEEFDRFIIGADAGGSDYCMAVATGSGALGPWAIFSVATDIGGNFFDYPHAGVGREAIYVGSNQFADNGSGGLSYDESRLFAIDKFDLYDQQSPDVVSWSLSGQGRSFTPQPANLHGYADGTWPTSGPHYVITDQFDSKDVNVWTVEDPFGTGALTRQGTLNLEGYTGVAAGQTIDPPQITGDNLDAGDFRVLDFEYRNGFGWTVQNVSCNPGSGTVNCVRWAQIDLAANSIADAGVFSLSPSYTLHPDLAVNQCGDMIVGFSLSGTAVHPSAWIAGRESDDPAGTLSFSQVQKAGATSYSAFDGNPLRWGDYTGATVGPDGTSLWYLGEWSASISGRPSNWSTHFAQYTFPDGDSDGVPESCDACPGFDDSVDSDSDTVPDGCDQCSDFDDLLDADDDGVPDGCDQCEGDDASGNSDGDAYCDDVDICSLGDDDLDADSDGTPDACDPCFGADNVDADGDGVCDSVDLCEGDDASGDGDGDMVCADLDCDDTDSSVQTNDRCGLCGGDGRSCLVLFPITDEFSIASTTAASQSEPSIAAGEDGFLVSWTSPDADDEGIRARLFDAKGTPTGDDFELNLTTDRDQQRSSVTALASGGYAVAWHSERTAGPFPGIAGRLVDGAAVGDEIAMTSSEALVQDYPSLAPTADGFQLVFFAHGFDDDDDGAVVARRFLADGTAANAAAALTGNFEQSMPDIAAHPTGSLVTWVDEFTGGRLQRLDTTGSLSGSDQLVDASVLRAATVAADATGNGLVAWGGESGDGVSVFTRSVAPDGTPSGSAVELTAVDDSDSEYPDVAALSDGGFLVVFEEEGDRTVRAQLLEADGSLALSGAGGLVEALPFQVNQDGGRAEGPAVAGNNQGTFFVVWEDAAIDGSGSGIAGRLFGTDADADDLPGALDNCPDIANADQADADADEAGDVCDQCPGFDDRLDADGDQTADGCDTCTDTDGDGLGDPGFDANTCATDNCPAEANPDQLDTDLDGSGDVCDTCTDTDGDGAGDPGFGANTCTTDNCPDEANADQADADLDGVGDVCDACTGDNATGDSDSDGVCDDLDACEGSDDGLDADHDGVPDGCDICEGDDATGDGDGDGICADRDCNDSDPENACAVFDDDFESGDVSAWSEISP